MSLTCERDRAGKRSVIGPDIFKDAMAVIPSAVTIVTSWAADGAPAGATLSAVNALSVEPALMLACLEHKSKTLEAIRFSESFLIHVLADGQQELASCFSRRRDTKFDEAAWKPGLMSLPQLEGCALTIACWLFQSLPGGDHTIIIGEIAQIETAKASGPLVYAHRKLRPFWPPEIANDENGKQANANGKTL